MKHIKQSFATTILIFVLAVAALAGEMHNPSVAPTPPPPPVEKLRPVADNTSSTYDVLTEAALLFCQKVLSIF
jgi:hypothetical protein